MPSLNRPKYEVELSELRTRTFNDLINLPLHQDLECCIICLEPIDETSILRELPCTHLFHEPCVDDWVCNFDARCPICREAFYYLRRPLKPSPVANNGSNRRRHPTNGGQENEHTRGTFHSLKHWWKRRLSISNHPQEPTTADTSHPTASV